MSGIMDSGASSVKRGDQPQYQYGFAAYAISGVPISDGRDAVVCIFNPETTLDKRVKNGPPRVKPRLAVDGVIDANVTLEELGRGVIASGETEAGYVAYHDMFNFSARFFDHEQKWGYCALLMTRGNAEKFVRQQTG